MASSTKLALLGGNPVTIEPWPTSNTIGEEEKKSVCKVLDSGNLSQFRASHGKDFLGGPVVNRLEAEWSQYFQVKHSVSMNSLTSGLFACIGAAGIGSGDEVVVTPTTMIASATCIIAYGAIPVFADIDPLNYCISRRTIEPKISPRTKAILVVHLFGFPVNMDEIMNLAAEHGLFVIEDCAQAPSATFKGQPVGTFGHMGGFSLNYHKTIHCGEGGIVVTNDDDLAIRLQLIRNHGEAVVQDREISNLVNAFGGNYRMTELEAAIAGEQLKKLGWLTEARIELAGYLTERLKGIPGLSLPVVPGPESRHVYYVYAMGYDAKHWGISRELFVKAINAEGIELRDGYVRPIYLEPMYQQKMAFKGGIPFTSKENTGDMNYAKGLCPVAEMVHEQTLVFGKFCRWPLTKQHIDQVALAFEKVFEGKEELTKATC
ncbi:MAG: DegT/DnrJ/EryC1/StrS family aminotransferase [Nitrospirae bacterium]|nr:DegT/DnrJ/EryC1/StrS family aminotransferase [Nitrospirota bacterium]